jgi:hypothetical protein
LRKVRLSRIPLEVDEVVGYLTACLRVRRRLRMDLWVLRRRMTRRMMIFGKTFGPNYNNGWTRRLLTMMIL